MVVQGSDPNPKVHLEGPSAVVVPFGSTMRTATIQRIGGTWPDVTYKLQATVVTDLGNTRRLWSYIQGVNS